MEQTKAGREPGRTAYLSNRNWRTSERAVREGGWPCDAERALAELARILADVEPWGGPNGVYEVCWQGDITDAMAESLEAFVADGGTADQAAAGCGIIVVF